MATKDTKTRPDIETYAQIYYEKRDWFVVNTNVSGFPDLFCYKNGKVLLVECKENSDRLKAQQKDVLNRLANHKVKVVFFAVAPMPHTPELKSGVTAIRAKERKKKDTTLETFEKGEKT